MTSSHETHLARPRAWLSLLTATERLETFPESGRVVPEFPELTYREIIVSSYRVLYRREANTVWITAVVHGRRRLDREPGGV